MAGELGESLEEHGFFSCEILGLSFTLCLDHTKESGTGLLLLGGASLDVAEV